MTVESPALSLFRDRFLLLIVFGGNVGTEVFHTVHLTAVNLVAGGSLRACHGLWMGLGTGIGARACTMGGLLHVPVFDERIRICIIVEFAVREDGGLRRR